MPHYLLLGKYPLRNDDYLSKKTVTGLNAFISYFHQNKYRAPDKKE